MNEPTSDCASTTREALRKDAPRDDPSPTAQWQGYDLEILNVILDGGGRRSTPWSPPGSSGLSRWNDE